MTARRNLRFGDKGHLALRGVDLVGLCEEFGTPLFVFDEADIIENFRRFYRAFESSYGKVMVCYSVKTNNNLAICSVLNRLGAYAEVSSEMDLFTALKAGFPGAKIVYDGPFKPEAALRKALKEGVFMFNVESLREMEVLNDCAREVGRVQSIGLRVSSPERVGFFDFRRRVNNLVNKAGYCYPGRRFGFTVEQVYEALRRLRSLNNLRLECLMVHPYREALRVLLPLVKEVRENFGFDIRYLNLGGGFDPGVTGSDGDFPLMIDHVKRRLGLKSSLDRPRNVPSVESIAEDVASTVRRNLEGVDEPVLVMEPGRFVVGPSGLLLLGVDHTKMVGGYKWVFVDGGTNLLPVMHDRRTVFVANRHRESPEELVNIVGPLLYEKDFVAVKTSMPQVHEGDIIAVTDCGAYSLSSSTQFLYPRPAAVLVSTKGKAEVVREKETFEDVLSKDRFLFPN